MTAPAHLPSADVIASWPTFTAEAPLRVIVSACLAGQPVGVDGTSYGDHPHIRRLVSLPNVAWTAFCPEAFAFGVPRAVPDCEGGTGADVLDGRARVVSSDGEDWTNPMIEAAEAMARAAETFDARLAILMDISAACGSQVIYDGPRSAGRYQRGLGVAAALLHRRGVAVVSQRDFATLALLRAKLEPGYAPSSPRPDHHDTDWYRSYFATDERP